MMDIGGDVLNANWWRRAVLVTDYILRQLKVKVHEHKLQINLAMLDYNTPGQTFDRHHRQAEMIRNGIVQELMPWVPVGPTTMKESIESMRKQYVKHFADPQSEKGKEAIRKQLEKWGPSYVRRFLAKR